MTKEARSGGIDFAQNDKQVDGASIEVTPSVLLRSPGGLSQHLLLAADDVRAVCHSPRSAGKHICITPPLRGSRRSRAVPWGLPWVCLHWACRNVESAVLSLSTGPATA